MTDLATSDYDERLRLARMDAAAGLGWADLVVRYSIEQQEAKLLVWTAEARRKAREAMADGN